MKLFELEDNDILTGYYDPAEDELNTHRPSKTRMPVLTLRHINRLKRMRALKKLEDMKREDLLSAIYSPEEPAPAGGAPF